MLKAQLTTEALSMKRFNTSVFLLFAFILYLSIGANAQHFHVSSYTAEDGLPEGNIHGITQDQLGFVWIASDAGLVRFDGERFKTVSERPYREVFKDKKGRVLAINSRGLWEVHSLPDQPALEKISFPEELKLLENPQIIEDHLGRLWIYGVGQAMRVASGATLTYPFPEREQMYLSEGDQGEMWAISKSGQLYEYNFAVEVFDESPFKLPVAVNSFVHSVGEGFWIGAVDGVWYLSIKNRKVSAQKVIAIEGGVNFVIAANTGVFFGTKDKGLIRLKRNEQGEFELEEIEDHTFPHSTMPLPFKDAQNPFADQEGGLWLSTDQGVARLTPNIFDAVDAVPKGNITAITQLDNGEIYNAQGQLFKMAKNEIGLSGQNIPTPYNVTALAHFRNQLWVGTFDGQVGYMESNTGRFKTVEVRDSKGLIFNMEADPIGGIWVAQSPNPKSFIGVAKVTPDLQVKYYGATEGFQSRVLATRTGHDQQVYFGAAGDEHYLYKYDPREDRVIDLSIPLGFKHHENFEVHDLHADYTGTVWMATTDGLLEYKNGEVRRINLGPVLTSAEMRGLDLLDDGTLWISTDIHGIIKYTAKGFTSFSENNGLITNISNYRTVMVDQDGGVFIGTAEGLEVSQVPNPIASPTLRPMLTGIRLTNGFIEPHEDHLYRIPSNSYIALEYLTLAFSTEEILYQTRIPELGLAWSEPSHNQELVIPSLEAGEYSFEVRAKEKSGHLWSEPSVYTLKVYTVWYLSIYAYLAYGLLAIGIVVLALKLNTARHKKRNQDLENLILERTNEIVQQKEEIAAQKEELSTNNEQLIDLNNEKNYYISVVAHDLKSPLNRISSLLNLIRLEAGELGEKPEQYLKMIGASVEEQRHLITDILDLQAIESHSISLDMQEVEVVGLIQGMVEELRVSAMDKSIDIHYIHQGSELYVMADPHYMKQVLGNLFSNAIKFSPEETNVYINVEHRKERVKISVKDEGPGISKEDQQKLFRKFQKLSAQPTAGERSTGLGLSIVKKFSEAMGGRVWCKSKLGEGATFILEIDALRQEQVSSSSRVNELNG